MHPLKKLQSQWTTVGDSDQQEWINLLQLLKSTDREMVQSGCALLTAMDWDTAIAAL